MAPSSNNDCALYLTSILLTRASITTATATTATATATVAAATATTTTTTTTTPNDFKQEYRRRYESRRLSKPKLY